jgi:hypothetical protein
MLLPLRIQTMATTIETMYLGFDRLRHPLGDQHRWKIARGDKAVLYLMSKPTRERRLWQERLRRGQLFQQASSVAALH